MCGCNAENEDPEHFLLRCYICSTKDLTSSVILTKLTFRLHDWILKNKSIFCCTVKQATNLTP